jgi:ornithine decarboxylase
VVEANYRALKAGLGHADIHYAVKANPAREIIERLVALGSHFDAASRGEIELCLGLGARPETISFGNTVKRPSDIAFAHRRASRCSRRRRGGAREDRRACAGRAGLHPADRRDVGGGLAAHAEVRLRPGDGGAAPGPGGGARAAAGGLLVPCGLADEAGGHVGGRARRDGADLGAARAAGHDLTLLNIGGGFPAFYGEAIDGPTEYAAG